LLFSGFVYAWSVLAVPISAEFPNWGEAQLSLTFTLCMSFFCLGATAAGLLSRRIPIQYNLFFAAILFVLSFLITARMHSLTVLYSGFGVLGGLASGLAYNSVMSAVPRWFPAQQGLVSGLLLMAFGASSLVIGTLFSSLTSDLSWRVILLSMGLVLAVICGAGGCVLRAPDASAAKVMKRDGNGAEFAPLQMLKTRSFGTFFLWALLLCGAGLTVIGQAGSFAALAVPTLDSQQISMVVGVISICNGLGRVIFGLFFDHRGQRNTTAVISVTLMVGAALLPISVQSGQLWLLSIAYILIGLAYGGGPSMCASITKAFFGVRDYATNFSLVNFNLLIASFASTLSGAIYDRTGGYGAIYLLIAVLSVAAFILQLFISAPTKK